ncbi:MAG: ABC transporter substrate-binding protein [Erysipelotrichia bacterium]|nr:ABC transporter substrate-binding protein [Erysipelotrichia bacterium]
MKKLLVVLLSVLMVLSMVGCKKEEVEVDDSPLAATVEKNTENYAQESETLYDANLGDFYSYYQKAKEATSVSERFALMAIAEAKLLESAVLLPLSSKGGNYAISRVAPYTSSTVLWGNDMERYHSIIVATELIKASDREEMKAKYAELKGTGTYREWAVGFLKDKGYEVKDTYTMTYSSDPQTWDVLATSRSADSEAIINTYDGLMEYDEENTLQPALAVSYTVSEDGLVYTFKLREGVKWVDSQGREVGEVTADDFVAAAQHCMDAQEGLEYLLGDAGAHIVNADAYVGGDVTDFSQVGVKAVDKYTLDAPTSYFMTMLGYGVFAPMNRAYFLSKGGVFGVDNYQAVAGTISYGTSPENIAYCGPYLAVATPNNSVVFTANESYWNKENVTIKKLTWLFNDGQDPLKAYNDAVAGTIDGAGLNASAVVQCKADELFDDYAYVSSTDATSYCAFVNINRKAFANYNDSTVAVSTQTVNQAAKTNAALQNVHFRRALLFALDRGAYQAQTDGEDLKYASMINSFTPGTFVMLEEETTVEIGGKEKTYPAGTFYGQILQDQLDADGVKIKAWDATADGGIGSSTQYDGWYNLQNAKAELKEAIKELKEQGVTVSSVNPVHIDLVAYAASEVYLNRAKAFKQSVEAAFEGAVIVDLVEVSSSKEWYGAGYYASTGYDNNYNMYDVSGWGPDFGDPSSYLDNFVPGGYMIKSIGIY